MQRGYIVTILLCGKFHYKWVFSPFCVWGLAILYSFHKYSLSEAGDSVELLLVWKLSCLPWLACRAHDSLLEDREQVSPALLKS